MDNFNEISLINLWQYEECANLLTTKTRIYFISDETSIDENDVFSLLIIDLETNRTIIKQTFDNQA